MIAEYLNHKAEREALGIPPKPLTEPQVRELVRLLQDPVGQDENLLLDLITHRVPAGVDEAAEVKAKFLSSHCHEQKSVRAHLPPESGFSAVHHGRGL